MSEDRDFAEKSVRLCQVSIGSFSQNRIVLENLSDPVAVISSRFLSKTQLENGGNGE